MNLSAFKQSLDQNAPPEDLGPALAALWHEAKGDWDQAHRLAQVLGRGVSVEGLFES